MSAATSAAHNHASSVDASIFSATGMVALITGGGTGIGLMMAKALAQAGAHRVYILGRRTEVLNEAVASINRPGVVVPITADVTSKASLAEAVKAVERDTGHLNLLICNSGIGGPPSEPQITAHTTIEQWRNQQLSADPADWNQTFNVNVTSVWFTTMAFLLLLDSGNKRGNIAQTSQVVVTSSVAAFNRKAPGGWAYGQSKAAVTHLVKQLAVALPQWNIRVNCIAPGLFPSEMSTHWVQVAKQGDSTWDESKPLPVGRENVPLGRMGNSDEMGGTILYLASRAGAWLSQVSAEYTWPSPHDELEDILSLQSGLYAHNFAAGVTPCLQGGNVKGRQNAAEWIRTAFHDMITHSADNEGPSTGGLDGSIWFELDRPANSGLAFNNTFSFFSSLYSRRASAADLLAMSVVVSHSACGGPIIPRIPFRAGRIDASEAGPTGVPEAFTPLDETAVQFRKAGLSEKEMIQLVACGHTLGGVHSNNHPQIVPGDSSIWNDTVETFDRTPHSFDNRIATEYVQGVTMNPLVIGRNDTLNSDKRIFGSDGNKTISELASQQSTFDEVCANVFRKMIDTVPAGVELSEPIEAVDVKPYIIDLSVDNDGNLQFAGRIRVRTTDGRDENSLAVTLALTDRHGETLPSLEAAYTGNATGLYGETFAWYEYRSTLDGERGIGKFDIHVMEADGTVEVHSNGGKGFLLDDSVVYQGAASCVSRTSSGGFRSATITAAVRKEKADVSLSVDVVRFQSRQGVVVRGMVLERLALQASETHGDWVIFSAPVQLASTAWSTTFDIVQHELDGKGSKLEFIRTELCPRN
ncbi:uncharacterized protein PgNI_08891 [Pyricularia grisea]|uniref:Peroxidase n=1 Tax=Pyricularia grisea TaxID=148305 RepID=A0A6P8AV98_PYRGI|nr:uncharacterized protein PgNI_08891 [Pyricularia grisea]TLD06148.1 hypothetical protein PgNI_08891 [Pyricularia grisea]